jgi:hypothetical protein
MDDGQQTIVNGRSSIVGVGNVTILRPWWSRKIYDLQGCGESGYVNYVTYEAYRLTSGRKMLYGRIAAVV